MHFLSWLPCLLLASFAIADADSSTVTELKIETTFMPAECPNKAQPGDAIKVHYTGKLYSNGKKFDSSLDRGQPFPLTLGAGQVIKGWDEGLKGTCLNEKRTITIPAAMGYGARGAGSVIPPDAALVFDVELVGLEPKGREEL